MTPIVSVWQVSRFLHQRSALLARNQKAKEAAHKKEVEDLKRRLDQAHRNNKEFVKIIKHWQDKYLESSRRRPYAASAEMAC